MDQTTRQTNEMTGPGIMAISALIFGYFGFGTTWLHYSSITGQFLLFVALLDYTLKGTAIAFALAAVITVVASRTLGNLIYAISGLVSAVIFVIVAILDWLDPQHTAMSPLLLLIFAAWNGYGAVLGL